MNLSDNVDSDEIAKEVHSVTGSDIASLCSEALNNISEKNCRN